MTVEWAPLLLRMPVGVHLSSAAGAPFREYEINHGRSEVNYGHSEFTTKRP